jgi:hypothetical protein
MSLQSINQLSDNIRKITDSDFVGFEGFPESPQEAAERWANVLVEFTVNINPPSISHEAAKQAFIEVYQNISSEEQNASLVIPSSYHAFAVALGLGMSGYVAVPPPQPISFVSLVLPGISGATAEVQADTMAATIKTWFLGGTATPPGGSPIPWT